MCIACFLYIHVTLNVEQTTQGKKTTLGTIIPYTVMTEVRVWSRPCVGMRDMVQVRVRVRPPFE